MRYCTKPCFKANSVTNIESRDIEFLKELYYLMDNYNIHRIYSAALDKKKIISAQQLLGVSIGNTKVTTSVFDFMDKHLPWAYFNIVYKNHIFRYNIKLKRLFDKYDIERIGISSFKLYQGIHITPNSLCVREVNLTHKDGGIVSIENLYLNIDE